MTRDHPDELSRLGKGLLMRPIRSSFRTAVAILDEPKISYARFSVVTGALLAI